MPNPEDEIPEGHPACTCPICDDAINSWEESIVVVAHGCKYQVHSTCLDEVDLDDLEEDEEQDEVPDDKLPPEKS